MTHPLTGYECGCDPFEESLYPCGGCEFNCRLWGDGTVHWREHEGGKHWHVECAFKVLADADAKWEAAKADVVTVEHPGGAVTYTQPPFVS